MIGTLDEAKEIYEWYDENHLDDDFSIHDQPQGWSYVGDGSSRIAYRGPSGAVYKVQRYADDEYNVMEHSNFNHIKNELPMGWTVPASSLYTFEATITDPNRYTGGREQRQAVVSIIALEWIDGNAIGYGNFMVRAEMYEGLESVGLCDGAKGNVLRLENGFCIVDAGETWLNVDEEVQFAKLAAA